MRKLVTILALTACGTSAVAAGIDSRAYSCAALHAAIQTNRFVFIGNPNFQDFVVSDRSYCGGGQYVQLRSVPTSDDPQCLVNYCVSLPDQQR